MPPESQPSLRQPSTRRPLWVCPSKVKALDPADPWYQHWAKDNEPIRDAWPWRLRIALDLGRAHATIGLLYLDWSSSANDHQKALGLVVYAEPVGWIERVVS